MTAQRRTLFTTMEVLGRLFRSLIVFKPVSEKEVSHQYLHDYTYYSVRFPCLVNRCVQCGIYYNLSK